MDNQKWFRLDNAAKIFPSVSSKKRTNLFRLSITITEEVNPYILQEALELVLPRFSGLNVALHHGAFWYYFDINDKTPKVFPENPQICKLFKKRETNGFLFKLSYFSRRISIEVFHALTDGTGALEFLKSVVFTYLTLVGKKIDSEGLILTDDTEERFDELQDSFVKNYDPNVKINRKETKALQFKGTLYQDNYLSLITGTCDVQALKEISKKYDCTVTQFIVGVLMLSACANPQLFEKANKPFQVFVPINLRKYFPSRTMRNFSLYGRTKVSLDSNLKMEDVIEIIKKEMSEELLKERLQARIAGNVKIEKNFFMRIAPLFIKAIAMKIGYNAWGESVNSFSLSNLGVIKLPKSMMPYVKSIVFSNGASSKSPVNLGVITYNNQIAMSFTGAIIERDFQRDFFRILSSYGLDITISSNEVEA